MFIQYSIFYFYNIVTGLYEASENWLIDLVKNFQQNYWLDDVKFMNPRDFHQGLFDVFTGALTSVHWGSTDIIYEYRIIFLQREGLKEWQTGRRQRADLSRL